jgi:hypothetical protein
MKTTRRWGGAGAAGLGLMLSALVGCQTYIPSASLTLPSPRYLEHPPQYIPPSPPFPLTRELASMEAAVAAAAAAQGPGAGAPLPAPLPPPVPLPP